MKHPIENTIDQQRKRAKRLVLLFGLSGSISVVVGVLLVVSWMDYLARFSGVGMRTFASFAVATSTLLSIVYLLWPAIRFRLSPMQFAHAIEGRFPELGERLTSSVSFLAARVEAPHPVQAGQELSSVTRGQGHDSVAMRENVIESTTGLLEHIEWDDAYDRRRPLQAMAAALVLLAILGGWLVFDGDNSSLAIRRTIFPWQNLSWPKRNDLSFVRLPAYVEVGGALEIAVKDLNDRLPSKVILESRKPGTLDARRFEMRVRDGIASRRLSNLGETLELRAVGGDDASGWHLVQVLPAPAIETQQIQVQPPAYLEAPTYTCTDDVAGASGSRLSITGRATEPVAHAELVLSLADEEQRIPLDLAEDRMSFSLPAGTTWRLDESGKYCVELISDLGLVGRPDPLHNLTAKIDRAPTVEFQIDALDGFVTRNARLPYRALIQDDFRVADAKLEISTEFGPVWESFDLLTRDNEEELPGADAPSALTLQSVNSFEVEDVIDLRLYQQIQTGEKLLFQCSATDARGQHAVQEPLELRVLTDMEFLERMGRYESELVGTLESALQAQLRSMELFGVVDKLLGDEAASWEVYRLQLEAADFQQQRVAVLLGSSPGAAARQCETLLRLLSLNRLSETKVGLRIANVNDSLQDLRDTHLPSVQRSYDRWIDTLDQGERDANRNPEVDSRAREEFVAGQNAIRQTLESLIEQLGRWQDVRSVIEQLLKLKEDQQFLIERVDRLQARSLRQEQTGTDSVNTIQTACADEQLELARRLERIVDGIREDVSQAKADSQQELVSLRETLELADRLAISGVMRSAADEIRETRLGIGRSLQADSLDAIEQLIESLRRADAFDPAQRESQFTEAQEGIGEAIERESEIVDKLDEIASLEANDEPIEQSELDELDRQQRDVMEQVRILAERLREQNMRAASRRLEEAIGAMDNAADAIALSETERAISNARRARSALENAQREVQRQAADEASDRFETELEAIVESLQKVLGQQVAIRELNEALIREGPPDERGELFWLSVLLEREEELIADVSRMRAEAGTINSLELVLERVQREMGRAADYLRRREEPRQALPPMLRAEKLLTELVGLYAPGTQDDATSDPNSSTERPTPPQSSQSADLRTIRLLQADVLEQTRELETALRDRGVARTSEEYRRLAELSSLQRVLSERIKAAADEMRGEIQSQGIPNSEGGSNDRPPLVLPPTGGRD